MYAQLGNIIFQQLYGFESFDSSYGQEYARHALINGKPRLNRTGAKLDEHNVSIKLHHSFCNPELEIDKIKQACTDGEILPFITGAGVLLGNFVIENISLSRQTTDPRGNIEQAQLSFNLVEHVTPDSLSAKKAQAKEAAFANTDKQPQLVEPLATIPAQMEPAAFMAEANTAKVESYKVNKEVATAAANPAKKAQAVEGATQSLKKINESCKKLDKLLEKASNAQLRQQTFKAQVATLQQSANHVKDLLQADNISEAIHANSQLQSDLRIFNSVAAPIAAASAQRTA